MLDREEYVEQAYLYRILRERLPKSLPIQELLRQVREELLASTQLPMAVDFLRTELEHSGSCSTAMARLSHYFSPFQTYVMREAEDERGRFDMWIALEVLHAEALFRAEEASRQGMFLYHFETICRNKLSYDRGLKAIANDPIYDEDWKNWILNVRRQVGIIDFTDLLYVRSEHFQTRRKRRYGDDEATENPILFGEREGRIALANRGKDPLYLFAALQRHLGYPPVPRPKPHDPTSEILPQLMRRVERIESRLKLMEEEQRDGIDLSKFYGKSFPPGPH